MESEFICTLEDYLPKYTMERNMTMRDVRRIFQLTPEPPKVEDLNEHIINAVKEKDWKHFLFFLHGYEKKLNRKVEKLREYDTSSEAKFTTFVFHDMRNAMLEICRRDESWSFKKLNTYKGIRRAAYISNNYPDAREKFAEKHNCSLEKAGQYIREAFEKLSPRDQYFLEKRNGICMNCGHVKKKKECLTFDQLGAIYNITTADGAEQAYRKAVENLAIQMMEDGSLHTITIKLKHKTKSKKKIAAAVYEYQVDCDGDWGEIYFDFETGSYYIHKLAEWDTTKTTPYAKRVIDFMLKQDSENLPKEKLIAVEK